MIFVIIGGGPAAVRALDAIKTNWNTQCPDKLEVTLVSSEKTKPYAPMFLMDYVFGKKQRRELELVTNTNHLPVNKILGKRVIRVKDQQNKIVLDDGEELEYDKLLIASGASPIRPDIEGIEKKGVYFLNRLADAQKLSRCIQKGNAESVIVIGGGTIGVEAAVAFREIGKQVTLIELTDHILLPLFDEEICLYLEKKLCERGIDLVLGNSCSAIVGDKEIRGAVVGSNEISGDIMLVATGSKPNIQFLESSTIQTARGIIVDNHMRTSVPNIFAAGDVVESMNQFGINEAVFTWHSSVEQGWVAGCNMVGAERVYRYCPRLVSLENLGFPAVSIGQRAPQDDQKPLEYTDQERGIFERIYVNDNRINCYQAIGVLQKAGMMYGFIRSRTNIKRIKDLLIYGTFNFSVLLQ